MKKITCLFFAFVVSSFFMVGGANAEAGEKKLIFSRHLPEKCSLSFLAEPGVIKGQTKKKTFDIMIPGLAKCKRLKIQYTEYSGCLPKEWVGGTAFSHTGKVYWPVSLHIAIRKGADQSVLYHEAYRVGFWEGLLRSGIDLEKVRPADRVFYIFFKEVGCPFTHFEEAIAEIGTIRHARSIKKPEIIQKRFEEVMKGGRYEKHDLEQAFIKISGNDPERYIQNLGIIVENLVEKLGKARDTPNPEKKDFDRGSVVSASR